MQITNDQNPTLAQVALHLSAEGGPESDGTPWRVTTSDVLRWATAVGLPVVCNRVQLLGHPEWIDVLAREAAKEA